MLGRQVPKPWSTLCCMLKVSPCLPMNLADSCLTYGLKMDRDLDGVRHRIARYCRLRRQDIGPTRWELTACPACGKLWCEIFNLFPAPMYETACLLATGTRTR